MSFLEKVEFVNRLLYIAALTVMVFIRKDLGYRLLNPLHIILVTGFLAFMARLLGPAYPEAGMDSLLVFAVLALLFGAAQRTKRWRQFNQGIAQHSYYIGTSRFHFAWLPLFFRRNRRMERKFDPIFCLIAGGLLMPVSFALGGWIISAGICTHCLENAVRMKELTANLDMIDSLIASQAQSQNIEQFDQSPNARQQQTTAGVPTGLGSDIQKHIKRRKGK
jgi:hypothetical protein